MLFDFYFYVSENSILQIHTWLWSLPILNHLQKICHFKKTLHITNIFPNSCRKTEMLKAHNNGFLSFLNEHSYFEILMIMYFSSIFALSSNLSCKIHSLSKQFCMILIFWKRDHLTKPFQPSQSWHQLSFFEKGIIVQNFLLSEWALVHICIWKKQEHKIITAPSEKK